MTLRVIGTFTQEVEITSAVDGPSQADLLRELATWIDDSEADGNSVAWSQVSLYWNEMEDEWVLRAAVEVMPNA